MPKEFVTAEHKDLGKGIDSNSSPAGIPDGFCEDAVNAIVSPYGTIETRKGYQTVGRLPLRVSRVDGGPDTTVTDYSFYLNKDLKSTPTAAAPDAVLEFPTCIVAGRKNLVEQIEVSVHASGYINWTSHPLRAGQPVYFTELPPDVGLVSRLVYYVGTVSTNYFYVRRTPSGADITINASTSTSFFKIHYVGKGHVTEQTEFSLLSCSKYYSSLKVKQGRQLVGPTTLTFTEPQEEHQQLYPFIFTSLFESSSQAGPGTSVIPTEIRIQDGTYRCGYRQDLQWKYTTGVGSTTYLYPITTGVSTVDGVSYIASPVPYAVGSQSIPASTHRLGVFPKIVLQFYSYNTESGIYSRTPGFTPGVWLMDGGDIFSFTGAGWGGTVGTSAVLGAATVGSNYFNMTVPTGGTTPIPFSADTVARPRHMTVWYYEPFMGVDRWRLANTATIYATAAGITNTSGAPVICTVCWIPQDSPSNVVGATYSTQGNYLCDGADTQPDLFLWGIPTGPTVNGLAEFKDDLNPHVVACGGGDLFKQSAVGLPTLYPAMALTTGGSAQVAAALVHTSATVGATRGYFSVSSAYTSYGGLRVKSCTYVSGSSWQVVLDAPGLVARNSTNVPDGTITPISLTNDKLTLSSMPVSQLDGQHTITAFAFNESLQTLTFTVTISTPGVTSPSILNATTGTGVGEVRTAPITVSATVSGTILPNSTLRGGSGSTATYISGAGTTTVWVNVGGILVYPAASVLYAEVTTNSLTLRDAGRTVTASTLLVGDVLSVTGYTRPIRVVSVTGSVVVLDEAITVRDTDDSQFALQVSWRWVPIDVPSSVRTDLPLLPKRPLIEQDYADVSPVAIAQSGGSLFFSKPGTPMLKYDGTYVSTAGFRAWSPDIHATIMANGAGIVFNPVGVGYTRVTGTSVIMVAGNAISLQPGDAIALGTSPVVRGIITDITNDATTDTLIIDRTLSTTVNNTSGVGTPTVYLSSTTGLSAGDTISIGYGTPRAETLVLLSVGTSTVTGTTNLLYTHTAAQADEVGLISGLAYRAGVRAYYCRLNLVDSNGRIVASATTNPEDCRVMFADTDSVNLRFSGFPQLPNYDYDRIDAILYGTKADAMGSAPFYKLVTLSLGKDENLSFVEFVDTLSDESLTETDSSMEALFDAELGVGWTCPPTAKYITSVNNRLIGGNIESTATVDTVLSMIDANKIEDALNDYFVGVATDDTLPKGSASPNQIELTTRQFYLSMHDVVPKFGYNTTDESGNIAGMCFDLMSQADGLYPSPSPPGNTQYADVRAGDWIYIYPNDTTDVLRSQLACGWWQVSRVAARGEADLSSSGIFYQYHRIYVVKPEGDQSVPLIKGNVLSKPTYTGTNELHNILGSIPWWTSSSARPAVGVTNFDNNDPIIFSITPEPPVAVTNIDPGNGTSAKATAVAHGYSDKDRVTIAGTARHNGTFYIKVYSVNEFELVGSTFSGPAEAGAFTSVRNGTRLSPTVTYYLWPVGTTNTTYITTSSSGGSTLTILTSGKIRVYSKNAAEVYQIRTGRRPPYSTLGPGCSVPLGVSGFSPTPGVPIDRTYDQRGATARITSGTTLSPPPETMLALGTKNAIAAVNTKTDRSVASAFGNLCVYRASASTITLGHYNYVHVSGTPVGAVNCTVYAYFHGLVNGDVVRFVKTAYTDPLCPISESTTYTVANKTDHTFELSGLGSASAFNRCQIYLVRPLLTSQATEFQNGFKFRLRSEKPSVATIPSTTFTTTDTYCLASKSGSMFSVLNSMGEALTIATPSALEQALVLVGEIKDNETFEPFVEAAAGASYDPAQVVFTATKPSVALALKNYMLTTSNLALYANNVLLAPADTAQGISSVFPSRLVGSFANYPELVDSPFVPVDLFSRSAIDVNADDGQPVMGIMPFFGEAAFRAAQQSGIVVVFKTHSIYLADYDEKDAERFPIQKIESRGLGCTIPGSIAYTQKGIIFANQSGIYRLNRDLSITFIGLKIKPMADRLTNWDSVEAVSCAVHHAEESQYVFSYPGVGENSASNAFVYDYKREGEMSVAEGFVKAQTGAWTRWTNVPATTWAEVGGETYFGSSGGQVFQLRSNLDDSDYRDDAAAIPFDVKYKPVDFGDSSRRKVLAALVTHFREKTASCAPTLSLATDMSDTFTSTTAIDASGKKVMSVRSVAPVRHFQWVQPRYTCSALDQCVSLSKLDFVVSGLTFKGTKQAADT